MKNGNAAPNFTRIYRQNNHIRAVLPHLETKFVPFWRVCSLEMPEAPGGLEVWKWIIRFAPHAIEVPNW
ncbi:MAG TPA: hypothetical protein VK818_16165 [Methylomirabilota bacterium]|jgi:hypothetical protein|nr:hypothetical protein [Methylomirabilota bacterium]